MELEKKQSNESDDAQSDCHPDSVINAVSGRNQNAVRNDLIHPLDYPVVIKRHENLLTLSLPDHNTFTVIDLPKGPIDKTYMLKVGMEVAKMWIKSKERIDDHTFVNRKAPSPSLATKSLNRDKNKKLTAPQVAKLLGVSADTVRRKADSGEIPCLKSKKGTRYFLEKDIFQ